MSETTTNLLTGFQATSSKGGELLGDGGSLFGETSDDTSVSFSSVLNQAQSDQADGSDLTEQTTRLARESASAESTNDQNKLPLEDGRELRPTPPSVDGQERAEPTHRSPHSRDALIGEQPPGTLETLEEYVEPADAVKPMAAASVSTENSEVETNEPHLVLQDNGRKTPEQLATQSVGAEVQVGAMPTQAARPEIALASNDDTELNLAARQSTVLSQSLPAGQSLGQPSTTIDTPITTSVAPRIVSEAATAATVDSGLTPASVASASTAAPSAPSLTVVTDAEQPVVSAATFANRLNGQPMASVATPVIPSTPADSIADVGTDAEQLTTIAGIQSVQAGISGLAQSTTTNSTTAVPATATTLDGVNSTVATLAPVQAPSAMSTGQLSDPIGQSMPGNLNSVTTGVNPALTLASNIPSSGANVPPASPVITNGSANSLLAENTVESQLGITAAGVAAVKDSASGVSMNPMLDNMLSTPASGIVTAPILAKADLTGTPIAQTPLNVPLLTPAAPEAMAGNVRWMVGEGVQNAVVNVSPNGMGPISVQIGIEKEQMSISIVASQANTREALESMLPRLRDQLSTQGVETVRVDISDGRGDRSGSFAGFERQNMGYTTADSQQNSQQRNTNAQDSENPSAERSDANVNDSGERVLSESERALVDQLKSSSTNSSVKNVSISHGYDLYV